MVRVDGVTPRTVELVVWIAAEVARRRRRSVGKQGVVAAGVLVRPLGNPLLADFPASRHVGFSHVREPQLRRLAVPVTLQAPQHHGVLACLFIR